MWWTAWKRLCGLCIALTPLRRAPFYQSNLGGDADTTGAVYGQLAGVLYGVEGIPAGWLEKIAQRSLIEEKAEGLFKGAENPCLD